MGSSDKASVRPEANMPSSATEPHLDTFPYDDEDERILMQMAEENEEDPPLSVLEAAIENSQRFSRPIEQTPITPQPQEQDVLESQTENNSEPQSCNNGFNHRKVQVEQVAQPSPATLHSTVPEVNNKVGPIHTLNEISGKLTVRKHDSGVHSIPKHGRRGDVVASHDNASIVQDNTTAVSFLAPSQDRLFRISKRSHGFRKSARETHPADLPTGVDTSHLTEDTLFHLLVTRIRRREEDAIHAAKDHKTLESIASKLAEENEILKDEMHIYNSQLQKKAMESRTYKSQINTWKSKLGKFRSFVDSLGTQFQALRGESIHLKATKSSLDSEKNDLRKNIEDIRVQLSQATSALYQKKSHRLECEGIISSLRDDLERSDANTKLAQRQLREEKKRITVLEAYIQNHCHAQERQLAIIRSGQFGIEKKVDSALEARSRLWGLFKTTARSTSGNSLNERASLDDVEMNRFSDADEEIIPQVSTSTAQMHRNSKECSELSTNASAHLEQQIQNLDSKLDYGLPNQLAKVSQQLKTAQESLRSKQEETEATKNSLCEVTKNLEEAEERATRHASEVATLQKRMQATESRVREELGRASVISRDQSRARFEQQLHGIFREKSALEDELVATKDLLVNIQKAKSNDHISAEQFQEQMKSLILTKDQEIDALQIRINDDTSKYNAQDIEMKRLQEAENSNAMQHDQLGQQLDALNQRVVSLESELSSREVNCEQLQTLRKKLDAFQAEASQKEKELLSMQDDLNAANTERSTLESGKTKAKNEIHTLLLRLQDSERWMKNIRESMEELGVSAPTESFEETWDKLGMILRSAVLTGSPGSSPKDSLVEHVPEDTAVTPNSRRTFAGTSPSSGRNTELVYRSQDVSRSTNCTPETQECFKSKLPNCTVDCVPYSQVSANIVPFSSFQKQLSPTKCPSFKENTEDFEELFAQVRTPIKCPKSLQNPSSKRRSDSSSSTAEKIASEKRRSKVPENLTSQGDTSKLQSLNVSSNGQEAVSFENRSAEVIVVRGENTAMTPKAQERHDEDLLSERKSLLSTQRTYSKAQQLPLSHRHRHESGTENVDHKQSPISITPRRSRKNSAREETKRKWAARGQKRPGRRTRGERYSTRFNQPGSDSR